MDRNAEAIERLRQEYPAIDASVFDLERNIFAIKPDSYDMVVCWLYLQRDLYPAIRAGVRPGGIAAISALLQGRFAAVPNELPLYFPGWHILHDAQVEYAPGHRAAELVVQRPR